MRSETVAVGCHRLPIGLFEPFSRLSHFRPVVTGCVRWALSEEGPRVKSSLLVRLLSRSRTVGCSSLPWRLACTPCRWELSRLLSSIRGRQAAKAKRELAETGVPSVERGAGLKGSLRESMCQAAIRILRAFMTLH